MTLWLSLEEYERKLSVAVIRFMRDPASLIRERTFNVFERYLRRIVWERTSRNGERMKSTEERKKNG